MTQPSPSIFAPGVHATRPPAERLLPRWARAAGKHVLRAGRCGVPMAACDDRPAAQPAST